jgi:hypothetical protein
MNALKKSLNKVSDLTFGLVWLTVLFLKKVGGVCYEKKRKSGRKKKRATPSLCFRMSNLIAKPGV